MAINVSAAFRRANTILNQNLGKFDSMNIIGKKQDGSLEYIATGITRGFYYKYTSGGKGEITEVINIVPENATIEAALKKVTVFELVNLDGSFTRFTVESKKLPERPSFQWVFNVKPNQQDQRPIT